MDKKCPICHPDNNEEISGDPLTKYSCPKCGDFTITYEAQYNLASTLNSNSEASTLLSYEIRKMQKDDKETPLITPNLLEILLKKELPKPQEQIDNLIMWLGNSLSGIGATVNLKPYNNHLSIIGTKLLDGFKMIITHLLGKDLLSSHQILSDTHHVTLTIPGWKYFEELKLKTKDSRQVFMAMKFGNDILDKMVKVHFKPAVADTGFSLIQLDDVPKAGIIDDRMRVEIRKSRFMIADLTHQNNGAYWESGFAEGLGKPVIYTCEKSVWDKEKSHFDTNHLLTVIWDKEDIVETVSKLKAAIRATLPEEAKLSDD